MPDTTEDRRAGRNSPGSAARALGRLYVETAQGEHDLQVRTLQAQISGEEGYLAELALQINQTLRRQSDARAVLESLEQNPPEYDVVQTARELRLISQLPGVRRVQVDDGGGIVVTFRTACLYKGRRFLMGDFELTLPIPVGDIQLAYQLFCTRSWVRKNQRVPVYRQTVPKTKRACGMSGCRECPWVPVSDPEPPELLRYEFQYARPLYWTGVNEAYAGPGIFQFERLGRQDEISRLWKENRTVEFVREVVDAMCTVNDEDWDRVPATFRSIRATPRQLANWPFGRSPHDRDAVA